MNWITRHSTKEILSFVSRVSQLYSTSGPLSQSLSKMVSEQRFFELASYKFSYTDDISVRDLQGARQIAALFQKQSIFPFPVDRDSVCYRKFIDSELKCLETNNRLNSASPNGDVGAVIHYAQRKIAKVLGDLPPLDSLNFSYGPGASTNVKSAVANFRSKLSAELVCSEELEPYLGEFLAEFPMLCAHHGVEVEDLYSLNVRIEWGKLSFVPKTSLTSRSIMVEPILNGLLQRGVGTYIRHRLKKFGVDLDDQRPNQRGAWIGSVTNSLATIDLSSASDSIAIGTVFSLLPYPWADFLSRLRTGKVKVPGNRLLSLEKFSSMGNGYTFELESLIFWGLCSAVLSHLDLSDSSLCVYGDDIVIDVKAYSLLLEVFDYFGFTINQEKSYANGKFRESCGADWLSGFDVRPFYLKNEVNDRVLYSFHNWAVRNCEPDLAKICRDSLHDQSPLFGPDGFGDGHLIGTYRLRRPVSIRKRGYCGGFFDTYSLRKRVIRNLLPGDWLVPSYSVYTRAGERDRTDPDIVRGSRGYQRTSIYTLKTSIFRRPA